MISTALVLLEVSFVGFCYMNPSLLYRFLSQDASFLAFHKAIYSAFIEDWAVMLCLFDYQVIVLPAARKI